MENNLLNEKFEPFYNELEDNLKKLKHGENRENTITAIISAFKKLGSLAKEEQQDFIKTECAKAVNLLNFMLLEKDQNEAAFIEDFEDTVTQFRQATGGAEPEPEPEEPEEEMGEIDEQTQDLINSFISEGLDLLEEAQGEIETLRDNIEYETINTIFRAFHSLKGMAGFLNFNVVKNVTHEAETLLDHFRKNPAETTESDCDLFLEASDFIISLVNHVSSNFTDKGYEAEAEEMIKQITGRLHQLENPNAAPPAAQKKEAKPQQGKNVKLEQFKNNTLAELSKIKELLNSISQNGAEKKSMTSLLEVLKSLTEDANSVEFSDMQQVCLAFEAFFLYAISDFSIMDSASIEFLNTTIDRLGMQVEKLTPDIIISGVEIPGKDKIINKIDSFLAMSSADKPIGEILVEMGEANPEEVRKALASQKPVGEILVEMGVASPKAVNKALNMQKKFKKDEPQQARVKDAERKDLRVDTEKLDKLFNLVGELLTAEVMVTNSPDLKGLELHTFTKAAAMLSKINRELQEVTRSIRMIPLTGVFNKMKRVVRNVTKKFDKKVNFLVEGEETEIDKNIIQEISDPLVHIIRNAIDHGVEEAGIRKQKGKNPVGEVLLKAEYEGNEILLTIQDDGKGLNRDKILNKAISKNLVKSDPDTLEDKDVWNFIFEPGFSTAEVVSDVSGRGVGMDVVRRNIEKLRGSIEVESIEGKGSKFKLRIPLTLAVMDVMLLRVGSAHYALPIEGIKEAFRPTQDMITLTMDGQEVVKVRNDVFSVLRLHEIYEEKADFENLEDGILLIIESRNKRACLFVDELIGEQQTVVKGLSDYIGTIQGITGSMILSDGEIGLILDIDGLIDKAL